MRFPALSLLRRRRNLFIFLFVLAAASVVGNPPLRARFAEAMPWVPKLDKPAPMLDAASLNMGGQSAGASGRASRLAGSPAFGIQGATSLSRSTSASPRLNVDSIQETAALETLDLPAEDQSQNSGLLSHRGGGLAAYPSPINGGGGMHGAAAGGGSGAGLPGGYSSGLRSDFNGDPRANDPGGNAENTKVTVVVNAPAAPPLHATRGRASVAFDPNMPFGASDLTKMGSDQLAANELGTAANQVDAAPLAAPEPGTLLLVASGVATWGSRALRRRRKSAS